MKPQRYNVHKYIRTTLYILAQREGRPDYKNIADLLKDLSVDRAKADYDDTVNGLPRLVQVNLMLAQQAISLVRSL